MKHRSARGTDIERSEEIALWARKTKKAQKVISDKIITALAAVCGSRLAMAWNAGAPGHHARWDLVLNSGNFRGNEGRGNKGRGNVKLSSVRFQWTHSITASLLRCQCSTQSPVNQCDQQVAFLPFSNVCQN